MAEDNGLLTEIQFAQAAMTTPPIEPVSPASEGVSTPVAAAHTPQGNEGTHGLVDSDTPQEQPDPDANAEPVIAVAPDDGFNPDEIATAAGGAAAGGGAGGSASFKPYNPGSLGGGREALDLLGHLDLTTTPLKGILGVGRYAVDDGVSGRDTSAFLSGSGFGYESTLRTSVSNMPNAYLGAAHANLGNYETTAIILHLNFTPLNGASLVSVTISWEGGALLSIGGAAPVSSPVTLSASDVLKPDNLVLFTPPYEDADFSLSATPTVADRFGRLHVLSPVTTVVTVDAVAQQPDNISSEAGHVVFDKNGSMTVGTKHTDDSKTDGWAKDSASKADGADASAVKITSVLFSTKITFQDYGEYNPQNQRESHYALIEKPAGDWSCRDSRGVAATEITLRCDASGKPLVDQNQPPVAGETSKTFFQVPVSNADILAAGGTIVVDVTLSGPGNYTEDTNIPLWTGGMASKDPTNPTTEQTLDNNVAYNFGDSRVDLFIDTIDSTLQLNLGWFSEGGDGAKNLTGGGQYHAPTDMAGATGNGTYAKIELSIDNSSSNAYDEHITRVEFTYDETRGTLHYNGAALSDGQQITDNNGVTYSVTITGVGDVTVTLTAPNGSSVTSLNGLGLTFAPTDNYVDADIPISYKVTVESGVTGASATFSGNSFVGVDAVADPAHHLGAGEVICDSALGGYAAADYGSKVEFTLQAVFDDPEEEHYFLVEVQEGWSSSYPIITLYYDNAGNLLYPDSVTGEFPVGSTPKQFFLIQPDGEENGHATVKVNLTAPDKDSGVITSDTIVDLKYGALSVEGNVTVENNVATFNLHGTDHSYDLSNNIAFVEDKIQIEFNVFDAHGSGNADAAFEDHDPNKHVYDKKPGQGASSHLTGIAGSDGLIVISINPEAQEHIASATLSFDFVLPRDYTEGSPVPLGTFGLGSSSEATFHQGVDGADNSYGMTYTLSQNADGTWTAHVSLTIPPDMIGDNQTSISVRYNPPPYNNTNLTDLSYSIDVAANNSKATGTLGGEIACQVPVFNANGKLIGYTTENGTLIVDSVADRPTVTELDANKIDYHDQDGKEQTAAAPGDRIDVPVTIKFQDCLEGGERHYIVVDTNGWNANGCGSANGLATSSPGLYYPGASTGILLDVNDVIKDAFSAAARDGVTGNYTYISPSGVTVIVNSLTATAEVTTTIYVTVPENSKATTSFPLTVHGLAVDADNDPLTGSDSGITNLNDYSIDTQQIPVQIRQILEPKVTLIKDWVYENNIPWANKGDYDTLGEPAQIKISNLHSHETTTITLVFSSHDPDFASHLNLESTDANNVMRIEYNGTVYPITQDANGNWICTITIVGDDQGNSLKDYMLDFYPGNNYNSQDIKLTYVVEVERHETHETKFWSNDEDYAKDYVEDYAAEHGKDITVAQQDNDLVIIVDAVAQQPVFGDLTITGLEGHEYVVPGQDVHIKTTVTFQDIEDGSERHYILVEARPGLTLGSLTLSDGTVIDVSGAMLQKFNGTLYYKIEIDNHLIEAHGIKGSGNESGKFTLEVGITLGTEAGASNTSVRIGAVSWEDDDIARNQYNSETTMDNNTSIVITPPVDIKFDSVGGLSIGAGGVYENDIPNAHIGDDTVAQGTIISISHNSGDTVSNLSFTYNEEQGSLYHLTENGLVHIGSGEVVDVNWQIVYIPAHNYSDKGVTLHYSATVTNNNTGQVYEITANAPGTVGIIVDAVAQLAADLVCIPPEDGDVSHGGTFSITLSAKFFDFTDNSEVHYILVEAKPNSSLFLGGQKITDTFVSKDGTLYYKIPVDGAYCDPTTGIASVTVEYQTSSRGTAGDTNIKYGALAVQEHISDGELTYHNNTAFAEAEGGLEINYTGGGSVYHDTVWIDPAYENNKPHANTGDMTEQYAKVTLTPPNWLGETAESVTITIPRDGNGIPLGELVDGNGHPLPNTNGVYIINAPMPSDIWFKVSEGYAYHDEDITVSYEWYSGTDGSGNLLHDSDFTVIVDAVAQMPDDVDAAIIYDDPTLVAVGEKGLVTLKLTASFTDLDGSEAHYMLVEQVPGIRAIDPGTGVEYGTVYLDGKSYYQIPVDDNTQSPISKEITLQLDTSALVKGSNYITENADGSYTVKLQSGAMSVEVNADGNVKMGSDENMEADLGNNVAWNHTGSTDVIVSVVDSNMSVTVKPAYEHGDAPEGVDDAGLIIVSGLASNKADVLESLTLMCDPARGHITLDGVKITDAYGKVIITDPAILNNLGAHKLRFVPDGYDNAITDVTWSATVKDTLSGDQKTWDSTVTVIVDSVAHKPDIDDTHSGTDDGHTAALSNGMFKASVSLSFADTDTSEIHYAVLQQDKIVWTCSTVDVHMPDGSVKTLPVKTIFSQDGKPYYAIEITPDMLNASGQVTVDFIIKAPASTTDLSDTLLIGGISVEPVITDGQHKDVTFDNNWAENLVTVPVKVGVVETTEVTAEGDDFVNGTFVINENGAAIITLSVDGTTPDGEKESVVKVVFTVPAGTGTIWYDGVALPIIGGKVTIEHFDSSKELKFVAGDHVKGQTGTLTYVATVEDTSSGAQKEISGSMKGIIEAVADAARDVSTSTDVELQPGHEALVTVTMNAVYDDLSGSEAHYFLVQLPDGLSLDLDLVTLASAAEIAAAGFDASNGPVYKLIGDPTGKQANVSYNLILHMTGDYDGSGIKVVAMAEETGFYIAEDGKYAASEVITVDIPVIDLNIAPTVDDASDTIETNRVTEIMGAVSMADLDGDIVIVNGLSHGGTPAAMGEDLHGIYYEVAGDHGMLRLYEDGSYRYTLSDQSATGEESFSFTVSDGYGGTAGAVITVDLAPVNNAPVALAAEEILDGHDTSLNGILAVTDPDGDAWSVIKISFEGQDYDMPTDGNALQVQGHYGVLEISANGAYTYTLNEGESISGINSVESFTYTVSDSYGAQAHNSIDIMLGNPSPLLAGFNLDMLFDIVGTESYQTIETTTSPILAIIGTDTRHTEFAALPNLPPLEEELQTDTL